MNVEDLDEFVYEFHERVLGLTPERRNQLKAIILEEFHKHKLTH